MSLLDRLSRFIDDVLLLPDDVRDRLDAAEDALEAGQHDVSAQLFAEVLEERATLGRAAVGLCQAREALGDLSGARDAIAAARAIEPDDPDVAVLCARLALRAGDAEVAAEASRDAVSRLVTRGGQPLAEACVLRARAERLRGRPDRAARELRKALSVVPSDVGLRLELADALVASGRLASARVAVAGIDGEELDDSTAARLGLLLVRAGALEQAGPLLLRAGEAGSDVALLALGRLALSEGRLEEAELYTRRAVSRGGGADALVVLAETALAHGSLAEAAEALAAASEARGGDVDLLRTAARIAPLDDSRSLLARADALERLAPGDPAALGARAWAALATGDLLVARALVDPTPEAPETFQTSEPRLVLGRAELLVRLGRAREAITTLDDWTAAESVAQTASSDQEAVAAVRRRALRAWWRGPDGHVDLAAAIDAVARFASEQQLTEVERGAERLRDELDRPLLLAVLGEFNAGKSTLINAFVGADVAPTGIVPTTATLNILRGGAERRVRVVRQDGTTREGSYDDLRRLLSDAEGASVDHVEIVLPAETLERVWILDTPGTNAIDEEHERLAREAARRADAALWLFDAGQAGKGTEALMLQEIRRSRREVVPVLNKVDRLDATQLSQVLRVLTESLGEFGRVVPIAARAALRARLAEDETAYGESGFPALLDELETRVFSRSRLLKRAACAGRLLETLDQALAAEHDAVAFYDERIARLEHAAQPLSSASSELERAVDDVEALLSRDLDQAYIEAATEVLAFVQPRTSRFARHGADPQDRAFLADVLERRLGAAADGFGARLGARVRGLMSEATSALDPSSGLLDARVKSAVYTPLSLYVGLQRGTLRGGTLHRFFDEHLPRATLTEQSLAEALAVTRVDPHRDLRPGLLDGLSELVAAFETDRRERLRLLKRERDELRARLYAPLRALRGVLFELLEEDAAR